MIGRKIKKLRELKGTTQEDLAKFLGVAPQTVYKYEKNINEPDLETTSKIAEYFNVTTDYLLGITDTKSPINEINKKIKDNDLYIAANSKVDLGKLAQVDNKTAKLINTLIDDFLSDEDE